jgi:predicted ArsR family transcriptional regulator
MPHTTPALWETHAVDLPVADPDDVLAQATRARLFTLLGDLGRPAGTEELAKRLGLHPNGVRIHLDRLLEAGLVERRRAPQPRGRPRDEWSVSAEALPGGHPPQAYGDLARWLARAIPPTPGRLRDVERAGREIGREIAPSGAASTENGLRDTMTGLGFQPLLERAEPNRLRCSLRNCPYRDSVKENREVVCTLHRGITRGVLDVLEPSAQLVDFVPNDPDLAGCLIEMEGVPKPRDQDLPA